MIAPFGGWHDDYHLQVFCPAIESAGLEPKRADDLFRSSNIVHDIWHLVSRSRIMLADLTGKNPNVFYELGLAHAARKPVLLVTQSIDDVPYDLRALRVISYDTHSPSWAEDLRQAIQAGLIETMESPDRSVLPTFMLEGPGDQPHISPEEKRLLELQQQMNALRAEIRSVKTGPRLRPRGEHISGPDEALKVIETLIAKSVAPRVILNEVTSRGVPESWAQERIEEMTGMPLR